MSETKRSLDEIKQEYAVTCQKLGFAQYQVFVQQKDVQLLSERARDLNLEAAAALAEEQKAKEVAAKVESNV